MACDGPVGTVQSKKGKHVILPAADPRQLWYGKGFVYSRIQKWIIMCLSTLMTSARIADKDITCYKIMWRNKGMRRGRYCSWVRCFKYKLGMSYHEQSFCNRIEKSYHGFVDVHYGFHSYIYNQDAHKLMESLKGLYENKVVSLLKCVIPAGSQYYVSQDDTEFCSDKIIIKAQYVKGKWVESFPSVQEK